MVKFSKFSGVINQVKCDKGSVQASKEVNMTCEMVHSIHKTLESCIVTDMANFLDMG